MVCLHENCEKFGIQQAETNFYTSNNPLLRKYPVCKKCIEKNVDLSKMSEILGILQQLDYPYSPKAWQEIYDNYPDTALARYLTEIKRNPSTRNLRFSDSEEISERNSRSTDIDIVTDEMRERFGSNFTNDELLAMDKKYRFLQPSFDEQTAMHTEFLISYIKNRVKADMATSDNDVASAKSWGALAEKAATQAGITPTQMQKADLIGGISTFSELTQIIEENADGVIPLLPTFQYRPDDSLDFLLFCYISYARHLEGKPLCKYEDVYSFYDKRKQDYIESTGDPYDIFKHDPTESNRDRIKKFIKMPDEMIDGSVGDKNG